MMKSTTRFLLIAACLLVVFAAFPEPGHAQDVVSDLLNRVNSLRASVGRAAYSLNGALSAAAQSQAQWMVDSGNISHTRPDGSGPRTRAQNAGYPSNAVSENIYGGSNASTDSAWNFWINSAIHYAGMVNPAYTEIGIGSASGSWGRTFVLVFGNPAGYGYAPAAPAVSGNSSSGSGSSGGGSDAVAAPPSFVVGVDESGNIQHMVQPGDTLGDIALIYGYTWGDLPAMMALNGMADVRDLEIGSIFLVPPKAGTYTPTYDPNSPTPSHTPTASMTPSAPPPTITPYTIPSATSAAGTSAAPVGVIPTAGLDVTPPAEVMAVVSASTPESVNGKGEEIKPPLAVAAPQSRSTNSTWLVIALGVQVVILLGAGVEFVRRRRR